MSKRKKKTSKSSKPKKGASKRNIRPTKSVKPVYKKFQTKEERQKAKQYKKTEKRKDYGLSLKTKTILWSILLLLILISTSIKGAFFYTNLSNFTEKLGDSYSIKTSIQQQWVFDGEITNQPNWTNKAFHFYEHQSDGDTLQDILIEHKSHGEYVLTDDKEHAYLLGNHLYNLDKKFIYNLLDLEDNKRYPIKTLIENNKDYLVMFYVAQIFLIECTKALLLLLTVSLLGYWYNRIRYKDLFYVGIYYFALHSYLYIFTLSFLVGLLIKTPLDISIILLFIATLLYIEEGRNIMPKTTISKNPFKSLFGRFKKNKDSDSTVEPIQANEEKVIPENGAENTPALDETAQPPQTDTPENEVLEKHLKEASMVEALVKMDMDIFDENDDLAAAYAAYQSREVKKEKDALVEISSIYSAMVNGENTKLNSTNDIGDDDDYLEDEEDEEIVFVSADEIVPIKADAEYVSTEKVTEHFEENPDVEEILEYTQLEGEPTDYVLDEEGNKIYFANQDRPPQ